MSESSRETKKVLERSMKYDNEEKVLDSRHEKSIKKEQLCRRRKKFNECPYHFRGQSTSLNCNCCKKHKTQKNNEVMKRRRRSIFDFPTFSYFPHCPGCKMYPIFCLPPQFNPLPHLFWRFSPPFYGKKPCHGINKESTPLEELPAFILNCFPREYEKTLFDSGVPSKCKCKKSASQRKGRKHPKVENQVEIKKEKQPKAKKHLKKEKRFEGEKHVEKEKQLNNEKQQGRERLQWCPYGYCSWYPYAYRLWGKRNWEKGRSREEYSSCSENEEHMNNLGSEKISMDEDPEN